MRSRPAVAVEDGDLELPITPTPIEMERGLVLIYVGPEGITDALEFYRDRLELLLGDPSVGHARVVRSHAFKCGSDGESWGQMATVEFDMTGGV